MTQKWSEEETALFKKYYPITEREQFLKFFPNRTYISIRRKAARLGLRKEIRWWTLEELDTLKNCYSNLSKKELFKVLPKKDWTNIRHKAQELGLTLDYNRWYKRNWKKFEDFGNITLSDIERGYLAGIIDGEGTIRIVKAKNKQWKTTYYAPFISITNTDPKLMSYIRELVKIGSFYIELRTKPQHRQKMVYSIASIEGVKQILEQIKGLLIVKKRNAMLVLEFIEIKKNKTETGITPRELELYEQTNKENIRSPKP